MLEVEVLGADVLAGESAPALRSCGAELPAIAKVRRLCVLAAASAGVRDGHLAVEFVDVQRITALNTEYRRQPTPTDVLSFPVDGVEPIGARELGDVIICPQHTA